MRQKALTLIITLLIVTGCASQEQHASEGRPSASEEARRDIEAGHLQLRAYGLVAPQDEAFARLMQQRLGVQVVRVAGCAIGAAQVKETEAYNRVMTAEIERRFGAGSVERLRNEAASNSATRP